MQEHVVGQCLGEHHQVERQVDVPPAGTAAPTGAGGVDAHPRKAEAMLRRQLVEAQGKYGFGLFAQGFRDHFEEPRLQGAECCLRGIGDVYMVRLMADEEIRLPSLREAQLQLVGFYLEILVYHGGWPDESGHFQSISEIFHSACHGIENVALSSFHIMGSQM